MDTALLTKQPHSPEDIEAICRNVAGTLLFNPEVDPFKLVKTICTLESSMGKDCRPRFEPGYAAPTGLYYKRSQLLQEAYKQHGNLIAFSFGPFQIMYVSALERGFPITQCPADLWSGGISGPYVSQFLRDAASRGAKTVEQFLVSYNGGIGAMLKMKAGQPITAPAHQYAAEGAIIYSKMN